MAAEDHRRWLMRSGVPNTCRTQNQHLDKDQQFPKKHNKDQQSPKTILLKNKIIERKWGRSSDNQSPRAREPQEMFGGDPLVAGGRQAPRVADSVASTTLVLFHSLFPCRSLQGAGIAASASQIRSVWPWRRGCEISCGSDCGAR